MLIIFGFLKSMVLFTVVVCNKESVIMTQVWYSFNNFFLKKVLVSVTFLADEKNTIVHWSLPHFHDTLSKVKKQMGMFDV